MCWERVGADVEATQGLSQVEVLIEVWHLAGDQISAAFSARFMFFVSEIEES